MGKKYSPVVTDLFMGLWEEELERIANEEGDRVRFRVPLCGRLLHRVGGANGSLFSVGSPVSIPSTKKFG